MTMNLRKHESTQSPSCGQGVVNTKLKLIFFLTLIQATNHCYHAYGYIPGVNTRTIAGLWKLVQKKKSPRSQQQFPLKEFTVHPKDKEKDRAADVEENQTGSNSNEILLMLKEDGSFQQYAADMNHADQVVTIPDKLTFHKEDDAVLDKFFGRIQGKWGYVDGKLILAADRPGNYPKEDTLLVGEVVAKREQSLADNPIVRNNTHIDKPSKFDTHLSVPKGKVNVGKFFYPKQHPSFFEQPMFSPTTKGKFELKQVLGSLNARNPEVEEYLIEKYRQKDFYGKRFLLTSHPLGTRRPKGNVRWSIKYNRYVEDPPSKKAMKEAEDEQNRLANIRVMEIKFFSNNTFATVGGMGEAILRGKYHIVGRDRDQLWMQVWRFGFGRAVSGSVYSEGKSLSKEDENTYWGEIRYREEKILEAENSPVTDASRNERSYDDKSRRIVVSGSVIFGYGLEPQPVGRFVMTEAFEEEDCEQDDEQGDGRVIVDECSDGENDTYSDRSNSFQ